MTSNESTTQTTARKPRARHLFWLLLTVPVILGAAFYGLRAHAMGGGFGFGPGMGPSPQMHKEFMEGRINMALDAAKATDSQRTAIKAIFARAFAEMEPVHQQHQQLHDSFMSAFAADTVDRAAVEKLRVQADALFEQGSKAFTKALLDAAQVLSAEQRHALIQQMREHHGRRFKHF